MMEISNETKAKVFAQYLGQMCRFNESTHELTSVGINGVCFGLPIENWKLILKPLDKITDEELEELRKITGIWVQRAELEFAIFNKALVDCFYVVQFLISKGTICQCCCLVEKLYTNQD